MATQSVGLNMTTLLADGVRADVLESLMPKSAAGGPEQVETSGELIPLNQVITRGEDVTGTTAQHFISYTLQCVCVCYNPSSDILQDAQCEAQLCHE